MNLIHKIKNRLTEIRSGPFQETDPAAAYNLWSKSYDAQPGNLMLDFDSELFSRLSSGVIFKNKIIADVGCGTGRHWNELLSREPKQLIGYDVSAGMLEMLNQKFPGAQTRQIVNNKLDNMEDAGCDVIISTLTIAHIENFKQAFEEWNRALQPGGIIIITDYHPDALSRGADRTFVYQGNTIAIKNYVHTIKEISILASTLNYDILDFEEKCINDEVKHYYEKHNASGVFEKFKNVPIIYGMRLKKRDAAS
jgi:ubiquinone/menaquinone biosynthesis C-methylase UbiE